MLPFSFVNNLSTFCTKNFRLFPLSIASTCARTSGWVLREAAFSHASARTSGSCTVRNRWRSAFRNWCWCSTQSSILLPNPPLILIICHTHASAWYALYVWWDIEEFGCLALPQIQNFGKFLPPEVLDLLFLLMKMHHPTEHTPPENADISDLYQCLSSGNPLSSPL